MKVLFLGSMWFVTACAFAVLLLQRPSRIATHRWDQPAQVSYGSHEPYIVYVVDESSWWNFANRNRDCSVRVIAALHKDSNGYGHYTNYKFHNYHSEEDYFKLCSAEWTADGITIIEPTGHKLFIPKSAFIGGR